MKLTYIKRAGRGIDILSPRRVSVNAITGSKLNGGTYEGNGVCVVIIKNPHVIRVINRRGKILRERPCENMTKEAKEAFALYEVLKGE